MSESELDQTPLPSTQTSRVDPTSELGSDPVAEVLVTDSKPPVTFRSDDPINNGFLGNLFAVLLVFLVLALVIASFGREKIKAWLMKNHARHDKQGHTVTSIRLSPKTTLHKVTTGESVVFVAESAVNVAVNVESRSMSEKAEEAEQIIEKSGKN